MKKRAIDTVLGEGKMYDRMIAIRPKLKIYGNVVERENGSISKVSCRLCLTPIWGSITVSETTSRDPTGRTIIERTLGISTLSNYRMVQFAVSNGGYFTTNLCADCANDLDQEDADVLEAIYCNGLDADCHAAINYGLEFEKVKEAAELRAGATLKTGKKIILLSHGRPA